LDKLHVKPIQWMRARFQIAWAIMSNAYIVGFLNGKIYQGDLKAVCVPGLNCYACPGALGSCPVGAVQAVLGSKGINFSWYPLGFLALWGALFGRLVCGWLCPFGLLQDLLHKIKLPKRWKRLRTLPGERYLRYLRYFFLGIFVIILPLTVLNAFGQGSPWFCSWVCPSGTLSGLLLIAGNPTLRGAVGFLFAWKNVILSGILVLSIFLWRPFCRYICPLGAVYGWFNPIALYRFKIDTAACTKCNICRKVCKLDIPVYKNPNSVDCVRCQACIDACPHHAILHGKEVFTKKDALKNA